MLVLTIPFIMGDAMELGGNITLNGFHELEPAKLIVVKKLTGTYVRKMQEKNKDFESLNLRLKNVHASKFEVQGKALVKGKPYNADVTDFNLFFALDKVLAKILEEIT